MKALMLTDELTLGLVDRPRPEVRDPNDVIVRVVQTGICGTDRSVLVGKFPAVPGVVMGHEGVGVVDEVGPGVAGLRVGDRVIINPTLYCGSCASCLRGRHDFCAYKAGTEVGLDRDGAFADYIVLPERFCHPMPDGMSFDRAVMVEPLACALNNIEAGRLAAGETAVIVGGGPVGMVCAMAAQYFGADVLVVERDPFRQELCREVLSDGIERVRVCAPDDAALKARGDLVIDTVGNLLAQCLDYAAPCGRVVVMGYDSKATATVRPLDLLQRGLQLIGAGDYNSTIFPRAVQLAGKLPLDRLVTHRFGLNEFDRALAALAPTPGARYAALKVVIQPGSGAAT